VAATAELRTTNTANLVLMVKECMKFLLRRGTLDFSNSFKSPSASQDSVKYLFELLEDRAYGSLVEE